MRAGVARSLRTAVSYVPDPNLLVFRRFADLSGIVRRAPHEPDFEVFAFLDDQPARVVDIGANRGQSIRSFRRVLQHPVIDAFEPNAGLVRHLERMADDVLTIHHLAIGETAATLTLHVPTYGHTQYDTRASLEITAAEDFLVPRYFARFDPRRARIITEVVPVVPLDDLGLAPTIVKIDVEGADLAVVRGAEGTLRGSGPAVMIERPAPESAAILQGLGFGRYRWDAGRLSQGGGDELNTLFLRPEHLERLRAGGVEILSD
jgi:FkbM family methyltransferase